MSEMGLIALAILLLLALVALAGGYIEAAAILVGAVVFATAFLTEEKDNEKPN